MGTSESAVGLLKRGKRMDWLIFSGLRGGRKKLQKKFWKAEKFPTFATRYGGNDERRRGRRRGGFEIRGTRNGRRF